MPKIPELQGAQPLDSLPGLKPWTPRQYTCKSGGDAEISSAPPPRLLNVFAHYAIAPGR